MAIYSGSGAASNGLVFCWDAANPKSYPGSGSTWTDVGGGSNNGTFTSAPTYSSANGGILNFNGSRHVQKTCTFDFSAGVSMELVFRSTDLESRNQGFFQANAGGGNYINFYTPGNKRLRWETWVPVSTGGGAYYSPVDTIFNNTWYHAIGTYTSGSSALYLNGANVASTTSQPAGSYSSSYTTNVRVGEYAGYINGDIAIARLYNRPLTAAEVSQNFSSLRLRFGL